MTAELFVSAAAALLPSDTAHRFGHFVRPVVPPPLVFLSPFLPLVLPGAEEDGEESRSVPRRRSSACEPLRKERREESAGTGERRGVRVSGGRKRVRVCVCECVVGGTREEIGKAATHLHLVVATSRN